MGIRYFCPLRVAWTIVVFSVLVRAATTGRVRLAQTIRPSPTTCYSVRTARTGATTVATSDLQFVLCASEQNFILFHATCFALSGGLHTVVGYPNPSGKAKSDFNETK